MNELTVSLDTAVFDAVVETGTIEERLLLAQQLAELLREPDLPAADRAAVVPAVLGLTADPEKQIRAELAAGIQLCETLDASIAFSIAADDDDIALPFILRSPALDAARLLTILKVGDGARQWTIAARPELPSEVLTFLIEESGESAVRILIETHAAALQSSDFKRIYLRFADVPAVIDELLAVDNLPPEVRLLETRRAARRMQQMLRERRWIGSTEAEEILAEAEERTLLRILLGAGEEQLEQLIAFMSAREMLTASMMLRAACNGHMAIVEHALAWLASIPVKRVRGLANGRTGMSLKSVHVSAGIPDDCFPVLKAAFAVAAEAHHEAAWPNEEQFGRRIVETLLTRDASMSQKQSAMVLDFVGRFADDRTRALASKLRANLSAVA